MYIYNARTSKTDITVQIERRTSLKAISVRISCVVREPPFIEIKSAKKERKKKDKVSYSRKANVDQPGTT